MRSACLLLGLLAIAGCSQILGIADVSRSDAGITGGDAPADSKEFLDAAPDAFTGVCNPLTQAGCNANEKCTWLLDALMPTYEGHIGCAPSGTGAVGATCMYGAPGATGYDNCAKGLVCGNYNGGAGICKQICDNQGGTPGCDAQHVCTTYSNLFSTGSTTPAAAGVCDVQCDPLADNDFDGPGTVLTKNGTTCTAAMSGCYGMPSFGNTKTSWTCNNDIHYGMSFFHRAQCTDTNGCAGTGPTYYVNSCSQGYIPLLRESSTVSTVVCIAMCKPLNCYSGNCGTNAVNQLGAAPHRCNATDARGTFNTATTGEECTYLWFYEINQMGNLVRSTYSDSMGFCFDHSKYQYDTDNNGTPDTNLPACSQLQIHSSSTDPTMPLVYFGAADLGCVDTATAGILFTGKPQPPKYRPDLRPLYSAPPAP